MTTSMTQPTLSYFWTQQQFNLTNNTFVNGRILLQGIHEFSRLVINVKDITSKSDFV